MKQGNNFKPPPKPALIPIQIGRKSDLDALVDSWIAPSAKEATTLGTDKKQDKQVDHTQLNRGRLGIGATVNPTLLSDVSLEEQLKKRFQKRNRDNFLEEEDNANSEDESRISAISKKPKNNQPVIPVSHFVKKKKKKKKKPASTD